MIWKILIILSLLCIINCTAQHNIYSDQAKTWADSLGITTCSINCTNPVNNNTVCTVAWMMPEGTPKVESLICNEEGCRILRQY